MKQQTKAYYDQKTDSLSIIYKSEPEDYYEEIAPGIIVEYNSIGEPIGLEIQNFSRFYRIEQKPSKSGTASTKTTVNNYQINSSSYQSFTQSNRRVVQ